MCLVQSMLGHVWQWQQDFIGSNNNFLTESVHFPWNDQMCITILLTNNYITNLYYKSIKNEKSINDNEN